MISRNGIAVDPVKWQETQRRANLKYAEKRRAAVVVSREGAKVRVRRSPIKKRAGVQPDFSPASRRSIRRRSGGRCELGLLVCLGEATQVHHRKLRRHGDHRTENGIHVCQECHASVHIATGLAYRNGWLVRSTQDPATVPVRLRGGRLVYLAADGFYYCRAQEPAELLRIADKVGQAWRTDEASRDCGPHSYVTRERIVTAWTEKPL